MQATLTGTSRHTGHSYAARPSRRSLVNTSCTYSLSCGAAAAAAAAAGAAAGASARTTSCSYSRRMVALDKPAGSRASPAVLVAAPAAPPAAPAGRAGDLRAFMILASAVSPSSAPEALALAASASCLCLSFGESFFDAVDDDAAAAAASAADADADAAAAAACLSRDDGRPSARKAWSHVCRSLSSSVRICA